MPHIRPVLNLSVAPKYTALRLDDVKAHLSIEGNQDDAYISHLIKAVIEMFDGPTGVLGRAIIRQQWIAKTHPPTNQQSVHIPFLDVVGIVAVSYFDETNALQTIPQENYSMYPTERSAMSLHPSKDYDWPPCFDRSDAFWVECEIGMFEKTNDVGKDLSNALICFVAHFYENRGLELSVDNVPVPVRMILNKYRPAKI